MTAAQRAVEIEATKVKGKLTKQREAKRGRKRRAYGKQRKHKKHDDGPPVPLAVYTIPQFCRAHQMSQAMYFLLKKHGFGPREGHVGRSVFISMEAAAEWLAESQKPGVAEAWRKVREEAKRGREQAGAGS